MNWQDEVARTPGSTRQDRIRQGAFNPSGYQSRAGSRADAASPTGVLGSQFNLAKRFSFTVPWSSSAEVF
jgi:hypothetical protein